VPKTNVAIHHQYHQKEKTMAHTTNDATKEANQSDIGKNVCDLAYKTGKTMNEALSSAQDSIHQAKETVSTRINQNPLQSAMVGFGIGVMIGLLIRR
jgi:ElaB/YqjD/DUF883 family membrane-anchored ribosome-binding protein